MFYIRNFITNFAACLVITLIVTTLTFAQEKSQDTLEGKNMAMITELNVNIIVKDIEPSIDFWGAVGFKVVESVPLDGPGGSGPLGFAVLTDGTHQFMMQSVASLAADMDLFKGIDFTASPVVLFLKVADINAIQQALSDYKITMPRRETFYGSTEVGYTVPDGTIVTFAEFKGETP